MTESRITYSAVLHQDGGVYDGLVRRGDTPKDAADRLAETLSGYEEISYAADFRCNTPGTGYLYRRFEPNTGYRVTISKVPA
jgi:hypothetical protein